MPGGNPQKEDGFTGIAHETVEALSKINLSPNETRVLFVIFRLTYGWQKKHDQISINQFQEMSLLDRANTVRALKRLESRNIIKIDRPGKQRVNIYQFNKKYNEWIRVDKRPKTVQNSEENLSTGSSGTATTHSSGTATTGVVAAPPPTIIRLKYDIKKDEPDKTILKKSVDNDDRPAKRPQSEMVRLGDMLASRLPATMNQQGEQQQLSTLHNLTQ